MNTQPDVSIDLPAGRYYRVGGSPDFFRACDVHSHVRSVALRIGCDGEGARKAQAAASLALRHGKTALEAVREALYIAAAHVAITKRMKEMDPPTARAHFWRGLALDCLGFVGLIVISVLSLLFAYALMGKPS